MRIKLASQLTLNDIALAALGSCPAEIRDKSILYITTDTREIEKGDLFIALKGKYADGEEYCNEAIKSGAYVLSRYTRENAVTVEDTLSALLRVSSFYKRARLKNLKATVAVTGSVGKTTTKEYLLKLLSSSFKAYANAGNFNNLIGMPLTVLSCPSDCEVLILEMGMNHRGEIELMSKAAEPNIAIITNIGSSHIGNLGSREQIAAAKLEIQCGMSGGYLICEHGEKLLTGAKNKVTLSLDNYLADCYIRLIEQSSTEALFDFYCGETVIKSLRANIGAPHNLKNLGYALYTYYLLGADENDFRLALRGLEKAKRRYSLTKCGKITIYDDSYNASVESIIGAINHIKLITPFFSAVIGDILELGAMSAEIHLEVGYEAARLGAERLYCFGKFSEYLKKGALLGGMSEKNIYVNTDIDSPGITAMQVLNSIDKERILLIKASNGIKAHRISDIIQKELQK